MYRLRKRPPISMAQKIDRLICVGAREVLTPDQAAELIAACALLPVDELPMIRLHVLSEFNSVQSQCRIVLYKDSNGLFCRMKVVPGTSALWERYNATASDQ